MKIQVLILLLVALVAPRSSWAADFGSSEIARPAEGSSATTTKTEVKTGTGGVREAGSREVAPTEEGGEEDEDEEGEIHPSSLDELELELELPLEKRRSGNARNGSGWSAWSEWSTCSRTCDGGASYQLRRCNAPAGCRGEPVRYRICNMQPCPEIRDFREQQCSAYNEVPYEGALLRWSPHYDEADPCALTCSTRVPGGGKERGSRQASQERTLVVQLAPKVQDGTRCRAGSLDMCISGKCQRVGCDLKIGSTRHVDECGVCGGDGSSCARPLYHWEETASSLCSATCGGGYRMSRPVCRNRVTGLDAEEQLCNASQKPAPSTVSCNPQRCPPRYVVGEWGPCSVTCGGGTRYRPIHCAQEGNGTHLKVPEHLCHGHKPRYQEQCNTADCPEWDSGEWSGCSVSCGEGHQTRRVVCRDARGDPSTRCEPARRPPASQPCRTGIECPTIAPPPDHVPEEDDDMDGDIEVLPGRDHTQPLVQPYPPANAERLVGEQVVPSESTKPEETVLAATQASSREGGVAAEVGSEEQPCLGPYCTLYHDALPQTGGSSSLAASGGRDGTIRVAPRPPGKSGKETYSWNEQGYTYCSASCLGGVQELIVNCVRESDSQVVSPFLCPLETRPVVLTRTCNDVPCPPRWNYSDFQPCSKPCGIGIQLRDVTCIHEVTRGGGNTVVVPNSMCPQPPPPDRQYCNVLDCPVRWHAAEWTKCTRACGGGMKSRRVECMQVMAQSHVQNRPASMCPSAKPAESKACNTKPCDPGDTPHIASTNQTYLQQAPKKKVTLKIGGQAAVFWGTQIKIKCPVKKFNRTRILWAKDHKYINNSKKYKISKKGALRIQDVVYRDSGIYTCIAGRSSADLTLTVKPRPGHFPTSEEIDRMAGPSGPPRQINNQVDPLGFGGSAGGGTSEAVDGAAYGSSMHMGEARAPQPFNTLEDHSHELGGPPLTRTTLRPATWQEGGRGSRKHKHEDNLWPFQSYTNSRGHRMVAAAALGDSSSSSSSSSFIDHDEEDDDDTPGPIVILGKGSKESLKFEWVVRPWSKCSQSCGGNGMQVREATCMVRLHNTTQQVEANLCLDAGLDVPPAMQNCGQEECPRWTPGAWTSCEDSRCFTWNTAMQRREVSCRFPNGSSVESPQCSERNKPPQRQECYNDKCKGTWKVGEWSECAASCEAQGTKYRILQCVWYGTKRPAGNACRDQPRPAVMKVCKGPPCKTMAECRDQSHHCRRVKAMNLCRVYRYQYQCCHTCRGGMG